METQPLLGRGRAYLPEERKPSPAKCFVASLLTLVGLTMIVGGAATIPFCPLGGVCLMLGGVLCIGLAALLLLSEKNKTPEPEPIPTPTPSPSPSPSAPIDIPGINHHSCMYSYSSSSSSSIPSTISSIPSIQRTGSHITTESDDDIIIKTVKEIKTEYGISMPDDFSEKSTKEKMTYVCKLLHNLHSQL